MLSALLIGFATGLRSQAGVGVLAWRAARNDLPGPVTGPPRVWLDRVPRSGALLALAGEMIGDKLSVIPSRLERGPLFGRVGFGALTGSAIATTRGRSWLLGALAGAAGAAAGSHAGASYRSWAAGTDVPDTAWALAEDAVALALAASATR